MEVHIPPEMAAMATAAGVTERQPATGTAERRAPVAVEEVEQEVIYLITFTQLLNSHLSFGTKNQAVEIRTSFAIYWLMYS